MQVVYELAPVIATIISAHCPGTHAREDFVRACVHGDWGEAACMIEGMLAEPWHLRGHQESRLREFLQLLQLFGNDWRADRRADTIRAQAEGRS